MNFFKIAFILYIPAQVRGVGVQIDGLIDLGPKWSYKYKLSPIGYTFKDFTTLTTANIRKENDVVTNSVTVSNKKLAILTNSKENIQKVLRKEEKGGKYAKINDIKKLAVEKLDRHNKYTKSGIKYQSTLILSKENDSRETNTVTKAKKKRYKHKKQETMRHKVKDDDKVHNFTIHIYKQSLKVFDKLRQISNSYKIKHKFEILQDSYVDKFGDFITRNKENTLKTRSSSQKVILNIINTSNTIMQRLANFLARDINKNDKIYSGTVNIFQKEINREKDIEFIHACKKLNACRTKDDYNEFIVDIIDIILDTNDYKIKLAADALTEVVKANDFSNIIDTDIEGNIKKIMNDIEKWDPFLIRAMFIIFKVVLINKNKPLVVIDSNDLHLANKTIAFHALIDTINKHMRDEINKSEWGEFKKELEEWRDGKRSDVQITLEKILKQLVRELERIDYKVKVDINKLFKVVLKPIE